ncbi:MAG: hypothetical protein WCO00_12205 [Rhodospirillaceae bacterium]
MTMRRVIGLMAALVLGGCVAPAERGEHVTIEPAYIFSIGVRQDDVVAMLGWPTKGPRFDNLTQSYELVYSYPFAAIQAETRFPNGTTRAEMVDTIHLFFSRGGQLTRMASRTDRWYSSFIEQPVQRITVLPRVVHASGLITAPKPPVPTPPPVSTTAAAASAAPNRVPPATERAVDTGDQVR